MQLVDVRMLIWTAIGFGVLATYLQYDQLPGLGFPLLIGAFIVLLLGLAYRSRLWPIATNLWLLAPVAFFSTMVALRTNAGLTILNVLACVALLGMLVAPWDRHPFTRFTAFGYWLPALTATLAVTVRPFLVIGDFVAQGAPARTRHIVRPVAVGVSLAVPFLSVFLVLFITADALFARALNDLWHSLDAGRILLQMMIAFAFAWVAAGTIDMALGYRVRQVPGDQAPQEWAVQSGRASAGARGPLGIIETGTVLALVLVLFVSFVVFQLRYLFLPQDQLGYDLQTITYSEYAREGFFQLLVVAFIVVTLISGLEFFTRRSRTFHHWIFNGLTVALIGCTLVIVVSAFRRLQLYGLEHSFTHLRLYSHTFTVWLGAVLLLLLVAVLVGRPRVFALGTFVTVLLYLAGLNLLNPDVFIASANLDHASVYGKPLDRRNFVPLGEDAVPVILARLDELDPINRRAMEQLLYLHLSNGEHGRVRLGWQSWNPARTDALTLLAPRADVLVQACADQPDPSRSASQSRGAPARGQSPWTLERQQQLIHELLPLCFRPTVMSAP